MKKNLFRIILTVVFIAAAILYLYPTYQDQQISKELHGLTGQDSLDYVTKNADKIRKSRDGRIKLGLDLKGGVYVVLDVDVVKLLQDISKKKDDPTLNQILTDLRNVPETSDEPILNLLKARLKEKGLTLKSFYGEIRDDENDVEKKLSTEIDNAIDRAVEIVRNRVDQYGVAEPQIQKIGGKRIVVELPGVSNPDEVRKLLQGTALLQFQMLKDPETAVKVMQNINNVLVGKGVTDSTKTTAELKKDSLKKNTESLTAKDTSLKESSGKKDLKKDTTKTKKDTDKKSTDTTKKKDSDKKKDTLSNIDTGSTSDTSAANLSEEEFKQKFPFFYLVRLNEQSGTADGYVRESDKEKVDLILKREDVKAVIPTDVMFAWSQRSFETGGEKIYTLYCLKKDAELTGKVIEDAKSNIDPQNNTPIVTMSMSTEGSADWARITGANINKRCAIVLDGVVYSAPVIRSKITGGNSQIEGMGSIQEAKLLEIVLKAGALPAPLKIAEERSVGPSLGEDSINKGLTSSFVALIIVALFMIVYYRVGGGVADLALVINVLFVMGIMASFKATLTLPGIAGLVLTLGMAVDTNVLIFERIREEMGSGKPLRTAVDIGYKKAFSAIIDSHVTSIITGIILYQFGSGPIQGFALTLLFGIGANLFTAIVITHFIFDIMLEKGRHISIG
ncbi:MAG TPA: protein translocase subunit SecD [Ignavibacteria bacterium]|nr:protein translocase subunit SecD [Ignavibacteria bacterium]